MRDGSRSHGDSLAQTARPSHAWLHGLLHAMSIALVLAAVLPARAQTPPAPMPVMTDAPCPPPMAPFNTVAEMDRDAARQEIARRTRNDWGGLCRHRAANAALDGASVEAVFIGDSITEFWGAAAPDLFDAGIVNRGIGAQTSPQMLVRFYQDVISLRPRAVHIMAGTNDIAGNTGPSRPEDFKNNIRAMVELSKAHQIVVILGSIPPSAVFDWRPGFQPAPRIAELNTWLKEYSGQQGVEFVDYAGAMAGPGGELRAELTQDGVHPDADGYAVMTPLAREAVARALASSSMPRVSVVLP